MHYALTSDSYPPDPQNSTIQNFLNTSTIISYVYVVERGRMEGTIRRV